MDKYRVTLTVEERAALEQLVSFGKAAARKLTHARILLLADDSLGDERPDEHIVAALGTSLRTVSRVRHQLVTEGVEVALLRRRQPLRPSPRRLAARARRKSPCRARSIRRFAPCRAHRPASLSAPLVSSGCRCVLSGAT